MRHDSSGCGERRTVTAPAVLYFYGIEELEHRILWQPPATTATGAICTRSRCAPIADESGGSFRNPAPGSVLKTRPSTPDFVLVNFFFQPKPADRRP